VQALPTSHTRHYPCKQPAGPKPAWFREVRA
jgi:hypothetical protein